MAGPSMNATGYIPCWVIECINSDGSTELTIIGHDTQAAARARETDFQMGRLSHLWNLALDGGTHHMKATSKKPEPETTEHAWKEHGAFHPHDDRLRSFGWSIFSRPKDGPIRWKRGVVVLVEYQAVAQCHRKVKQVAK